MQRLLTTTAVALIATLAASAHAQDATNTTNMKSTDAAMNRACAENWTAADTDGNGRISKAEADAATDAEFTRIDANGDGKISNDEWTMCGDRTAYPGVREGLRSEEFSQTDATQQTGATQQQTEATQQVSPASDQARADLEVDEPATTSSIGAAFQDDFGSADADQSGYLSPDEAMNSSQRVQADDTASAEMDAQLGSSIFAALDKDGDGQVSQEEWSTREDRDILSGANARYGTIDADGNDEVSRDEWRKFRGDQVTAAQEESGGQEVPVRVFYYWVW